MRTGMLLGTVILGTVLLASTGCSENAQPRPPEENAPDTVETLPEKPTEPEVVILRGDVYAAVTHVVSGDTIDVKFLDGQAGRVRYAGISAPENGQEYFDEAAAANRVLVEGKAVYLVRGEHDQDDFGNLLRYVYSGSTLVNAEMVASGHAYARAEPPDGTYGSYFRALEKEAREAGRGFWVFGEDG